MSMYFTGQTKMDWGKLLQLHRCPMGHQYWVTSEQSRSYNPPSYTPPTYSTPSYNYGSVKCPLDGMIMYFTGRMNGLTKVYRCPSGHEADVR